MKKDNLIIFDTTLRDGEQSPGASMSMDEKLHIARQLDRLQVDVIEAGFPAASEGDFKSVEKIAEAIKNTKICALSRAFEKDIETAGKAIRKASSGRIHTFIATSPIHMSNKLKMTPDQVIKNGVHAVKFALNFTDDVEFSAEDAIRSEFNFLCEVFEAAIDAGAKTVNVPDTVGYSLPHLSKQLFKNLISTVSNSDQAIWSTHCHNDLGLAVANSLAAIQSGARQVECTINGLGERAGNAALEEIVMTIKTHPNNFDCVTNINTKEIIPTSRLVSQVTGYPVQPNKAIVGANAFAHESGIHQDGVLKHRETYEIMNPEDIGLVKNKLSLGKLSGRSAFKARLLDLGIALQSNDELDDAFKRFKSLADKKREIFDEDLHSLLNDKKSYEQQIQLVDASFSSKKGEKPKASITLMISGLEKEASSTGSGPVDAAFKAIELLSPSHTQLLLYSVNAITTGTDAQGEVTVRLSKNNQVVNGQGADTDIVIASAKAYIDALNKLYDCNKRINPQL